MKLKLMKVIAVMMALCFAVQFSTVVAIILEKATPTIIHIHFLVGKIFLTTALVHITLNWVWIKSQIFGIKSKKTA